MASRPAFAALGCLQCRNTVLRAVTSKSAPFLRAPAITTTASLRPRNLQRAFSSVPEAPKPSDEPTAQAPEADSKAEEHLEDLIASEKEEAPWFLEVEAPTHPPRQEVSPLPELPSSPPPLLEPLLKYVYEEMGLDDLSLLDLRALDPPPALGPNLLMLFATARSERHLHVSASRLVKWLRFHYRIEANADGLIGPGELKTKLRRMRRKAKLLGSSAMVAKGGDDGISTGWICVNLGTSGSTYSESERFDSQGKMSGFGGPVTGSTIVVQVMTKSRRNELDLERLWSQQLVRSEAQERKLADEDSSYHNRYGDLPTTTIRARKPNYTNTLQRRNFSTSLSRPSTDTQQAPVEAKDAGSTPSANSSSVTDPLNKYRQRIEKIRFEGELVSVEDCLDLLRAIFRAPPAEEDHSQDQADLATKVIETMHERKMPVMDHEMLTTIIEAIATSPARGGPEQGKLRDIQSNLEFVMLKGMQSSPTEAQLVRLLRAYAIQRNLEQFWEIWSLPARYGERRGPALYREVFSIFARINRRSLSIDALRKCVPEMVLEQPPVLPDDTIWSDLKACIHLADPNAEHISAHMVSGGKVSNDGKRVGDSEFVRMFKELEALRKNT
ncbi:hypothetical protein CORC01_09542 [Colletotrichum orchidophilum]|uniref:ATPase synthesis protein 25 n=1 Tax=Colletotrichum orchidophilum TaxID=1209926 RepID=A0A1G4B1F7_9PEZI|nr:uncharacterized protein CORC01_09542 [Colletotrichum orchidophilum]OHE95155.1 hypothetical protein CORC01_09542 [Colletotrichum orchidophilum]